MLFIATDYESATLPNELLRQMPKVLILFQTLASGAYSYE